ncbi:MAG: ergothioneine biosynthesis protein EgtB [Burkholderiaceae bacterium]|nr:ergothioneine biosynthesis protein EgtB [Burkholderiaceae bacterium]
MRQSGAAWLAGALAATRAQTLTLFDAWRTALPASMEIRYAPELNPPRWELGHVAWFEERWLARNPERLRGAAANPQTGLGNALLPRADALYDSSTVAHTRRWHLDLPDAQGTLRYAAQVRERTQALLVTVPDDDDALYFFRWALAHEAMHAEASVTMAQHLALPIAATLPSTGPAPGPEGQVACAGGDFVLGHVGAGFHFDNEEGQFPVTLSPYEIDRSPVTWARFRAFIDAGGYVDAQWWTTDGWAWRQRHSSGRPRHLLLEDGVWQRAAFGAWVPMTDDEPVMHLTQHEAQAWCRWAGRRLPSEAEWQWAALNAEGFAWGEVWEWTATPFEPWPGFVPHPYRDFSQPWFDGRPVLRGAGFATPACLRHPHYRNFFPAERSDLFAGFRSCAA